MDGAMWLWNVLNCVPAQMVRAVKSDMNDIQHAGVRVEAEVVLTIFFKKYGSKYEKGVVCLKKDKEVLHVFIDFPAGHWGHSRMSNPIKSVSESVRYRTRTKNHRRTQNQQWHRSERRRRRLRRSLLPSWK